MCNAIQNLSGFASYNSEYYYTNTYVTVHDTETFHLSIIRRSFYPRNIRNRTVSVPVYQYDSSTCVLQGAREQLMSFSPSMCLAVSGRSASASSASSSCRLSRTWKSTTTGSASAHSSSPTAPPCSSASTSGSRARTSYR